MGRHTARRSPRPPVLPPSRGPADSVGVDLGQLAGAALGPREGQVVVALRPLARAVLVAALVQHGGEGVLVHVHVGDGVQQTVDAVREVVHARVAATFRVPGEKTGVIVIAALCPMEWKIEYMNS